MDTSRTPDRAPVGQSKMESLITHQEIFLRILAFLDTPNSLSRVQGVNSYWASMALDPQLWKRLYLSRYPHPHHSKLVYASDDPKAKVARPSTPQRVGSSSSTPRSLRPIARLPSRAFPPPSPGRSPSSSSIVGKDATGSLEPRASAKKPLLGRSGGLGHAIPLSRREAAEASFVDSEEVGSGVRNDGVDWKLMMRLGMNWYVTPEQRSKGNASTQTTITLPPSPSPSIGSIDLPSSIPDESSTRTRSQGRDLGTEQHIALSPSFIFTSNPASPLVHIYTSSSSPSVRLGIIPPPPGWSSPSRPDNVTAIAADQSVSAAEEDNDGPRGTRRDLPARLAIFYQSGGYVVLSIRTTEVGGSSRMTWSRESILPPTSRPRRRTTAYAPRLGDPVVLAVLYHPVLVTCTLGFHVSVYTLPSPFPSSPNAPEPTHLSTLHSDVSYHPAALSLFPTSTTTFRASLTYCTPVYPASWTVAAQEFDIRENEVHRAEAYHVDVNNRGGEEEDDNEEIVWPRRIKPVIGVKGRRATGIGTDGRWCILSGGDNQIQVYALPDSESGPSSPKLEISGLGGKKRGRHEETGGITHAQTLVAHSARVTSVSLSAGRCVSGGNDGRVLVWDLDDESLEEEGQEEGRIGKTVGYVEVRTDEERVWRGAAGPRAPLVDHHSSVGEGEEEEEEEEEEEGEREMEWVHPQAISSAARSFFLPQPPIELESLNRHRETKPAIRQLAFDEEKIVGLISAYPSTGEVGEIMKIWNFG